MESQQKFDTPRTECALHCVLAPADLAALAPLRARLRAALTDWGLAALADTAELLASELVTNALQHAGTGARLDAVVTAERRLLVEVRDEGTGLPRPRPADADATNGRGLLLVEALADRWGVRLRADGKVTWFELQG
ncbi:ATP-binding protein [Kitasatospora viridis]|uniref:Anti-sigma regulatory factor (Ser/Thr protein kinase) n=1 Tax=Kitasatospora viridis TaxID=281105 RepID=A0A561UMP6_9ACTN|nr:ATP-binding protein [Kitasatospora viridis]TWG00632.1 anti-sigma regulatory factor (Ser/Thr protein kinase) [Kitasatospora viridis]